MEAQENIKNMKIIDRIREVQRLHRLNERYPEYIIMTRKEYEELIDDLIDDKTLSCLKATDIPKIMGMQIILDEKKIIRLTDDNN